VSVYHQAIRLGRITAADVRKHGSISRALKAAKRREAEERNERTPYRRTKRYRREIGAR
jgi:hypothetical protein